MSGEKVMTSEIVRPAIRLLLVVLLAFSFPAVTKGQNAQAVFDKAKPAIVKIRVEGFDPDNRSKNPEEGSGVIVYSKKGITTVVTAAHVIGSSQTLQQLNTDWLVNDLDRTIRRTIKIFAVNQNEILTEIPGSAAVIGQDDQRDIAVLSFLGSGFPIIQTSRTFGQLTTELIDSLSFGFEKGKSFVSFNSGKGRIEPSDRFGFGFVIDTRVDEGRSGGPIIDVRDGKVVAIASHNLGAGARHEATPIAFAIPILSTFYRNIGESDVGTTAEGFFRRAAKTSVKVAGSSGTFSSPVTQEADLDHWGEATGRGGEKSECDEGSGRTISEAKVRGQVSSYLQDGLRFFYEARVQGGHYRTAAFCAAGNPVGLTGHDTESSAEVSLRGEIEFAVARDGIVRLMWAGMPPHAKYVLSKVEEQVKEVEMQGDGSKSFSAETGKTYRLVVRIDGYFRNRGACCPQDEVMDSKVQVQLPQ
jgi:hypothetical protein